MGPAVVRPAPATPLPSRAVSMLMVSWNVQVGGGAVPALVRRLRAGAFTGGVPVIHFVLLLPEPTFIAPLESDRIDIRYIEPGEGSDRGVGLRLLDAE